MTRGAEPSPAFMPCLSRRLSSLIWSLLDSGSSRSAVFYAERFYAMDHDNHEARHLYCRSLMDEKQYYSAMALVNQENDRCGGCLELEARCCTALGRHRQAYQALRLTILHPSSSSLLATPPRHASTFPDEAALHCRSGTMALKGNLIEEAKSSFRQALRLNPMLWEAFEGLCALGDVPPIDDLFPSKQPPSTRSAASFRLALSNNGPTGFSTPEFTRQSRTEQPQHQPFRFRDPSFAPRDSLASNDSSFQFTDISFQYPHHQHHHHPGKQSLVLPGVSSQFTRPLSSAEETGPDRKKLRSEVRPPEDPSKKATTRSTAPLNTTTRRSARLMGGSNLKVSKPIRRRGQPHGRSQSLESEDDELLAAYPPSPPPGHSSEVPLPPHQLAAEQERVKQETLEQEQADSYIYELVRKFASATRALALYQCQQCIDELAELPPRQQQTPAVLALVGRAHYEKLDYTSAERAFQSVRSLDPYRLWDMEVYSSLLWHLQRNVELAWLAQELLNIDPSSPQTWIAIGNLFSLQKEKSQAMTCFRRATEVDPGCAYAYTLSGHECIDEDLSKAICFFEQALRADRRHYNAWYGLGTCYLRMSKIRLAEYHYRQASAIHTTNAVLLGCVGMTIERKGDHTHALSIFDTAVELAPDNALVRYRRAKLLITLKQYKKAVADLEFLRSATPEEANVVFQLAKAYRLMGDGLKSQQTLAVARDMAPKNIGKIKKLLETVRDPTVDRMEEG